MPVPPEISAGVEHFNAGRYFEAHEAWEEHWGAGARAERDLVKGLIKVAVGFHHLRNGNEAGFFVQVREAVPLVRDNAHVFPELALAAFAEEADSAAAQQRFHGRVAELPRILRAVEG